MKKISAGICDATQFDFHPKSHWTRLIVVGVLGPPSTPKSINHGNIRNKRCRMRLTGLVC